MEKYLAFISYRHQKLDQNVSYLLRRYLESFHLPASCPIPKRRKCFRDTDELPTSTDLGSDIEQALTDSDYLIAVCSEEYVKSKWCMREIELYIQQGKKDRILPVLVSGTPETSIPEQIRDIPLALDLRDAGRGRIRDQIPHLLSLMSGTDASDIASSDNRFRVLSYAAIFGGIGALLLGVVLYFHFTAIQIRENNVLIREKTEEAKQAEADTEQKIYDLYAQQDRYIAKQTLLKLQRGDDIDAINTALDYMPWFYDSPSYALDLPEPEETVDALRMVLAMPRRQRLLYDYWGTVSIWEYSDYDQPEDMPYSLTGQFAVSPARSGPDASFLNTRFLFETTADDGTYIKLFYDEYGWPEVEEAHIDPGLVQQGFSHTFSCPDKAQILYGKRHPMTLRADERGAEDLIYCVDGEPFAAVKIRTSPGECRFILAADAHRTVLFARDRAEAIAVLPINGAFTCAAFNPTMEQLAVIDADGRLYTFLTKDGTLTGQREDPFRFITYANENYRLYAASEDGIFQRLNALTLDTEVTFEVPRPVLYASYCAVADTWLLTTDSYALIYTLDNDIGTVVDGYYITSEYSEPLYCCWLGFDEAGYTHEANGFIVVCDQWINCYKGGSTYDTTVSFALVDVSTAGKCINVLYSADGSHAYLQYENGDLYAWNLWNSDPFEWYFPALGNVPVTPDSVMFSRDGTSLWRAIASPAGPGIERVDAEYGYAIIRILTDEEYDISRISECNSRWDTLAHAKNTDRMFLFDADDGYIYWAKDDVGYGIFSEDETEILSLDIRPAKDDGAGGAAAGAADADDGVRELVLRRLELEYGDVLEEVVLGTLPQDTPGEIRMDQENLTALVDDTWLVDLAAGTMKQLTSPLKEPPLMFAGKEVVLVQKDGHNTLVNAQDGHLVIDAGNQQIAVSPDGDNIILYGGDKAPYLIWGLDEDEVMDAAYWRLSDWEDTHDWEDEVFEDDGDL